MHFDNGTILQDHRQECRWKVGHLIETRNCYRIWKVYDQSTAGVRECRLLGLHYAKVPQEVRSEGITQIRRSFFDALKGLSLNFSFLPTSIDLFTITNQVDRMEYELREKEPLLVFAPPPGFKPSTMGADASNLKISRLKNLVNQCLSNLEQLHNKQWIIRELPLSQIRLNHIHFSPQLWGFTALYSLRTPSPRLAQFHLLHSPVFTAPECLSQSQTLSPATDIYALGKLILQLVLTPQQVSQLFSASPQGILEGVETLQLPQSWLRFLSLCLQEQPQQRFQNATEALQFLSSMAPKPHPPPQRQKVWTYRETPQLPKALLVIWAEGLTSYREQINFHKLYQRFQYRYTLSPRLFFQKSKNVSSEPQSANPFFALLKDKFLMEVVEWTRGDQPMQLLNDYLEPLFPEVETLILVAASDVFVIQKLFEMPYLTECHIHWAYKGSWRPQQDVAELIDIGEFLQHKKGAKR